MRPVFVRGFVTGLVVLIAVACVPGSPASSAADTIAQGPTPPSVSPAPTLSAVEVIGLGLRGPAITFAGIRPSAIGLRPVGSNDRTGQIVFAAGDLPSEESLRAVQAAPDTHGIAVISIKDPVVHPCPAIPGGSSRAVIRSDPAGFAEDMHTVAGAAFTPIDPITLLGQPALKLTILPRPEGCQPDVHLQATILFATMPSRWYLTQVGGTTILIDIWAPDDLALEAFLPDAVRLVDSIRFIAP